MSPSLLLTKDLKAEDETIYAVRAVVRFTAVALGLSMLDGPRKEVKPFHKPAIPFIPF
jgi:hypothetical protein